MAYIEPVAHIFTPYKTKFAIPRQSGLVDNISKIVFEKKYRSVDAVRGLEGFSHLWLIWEFSENAQDNFKLTVRPPRLGGNTRIGVFASRSPFRPNSLGLSCVEIEKIDYSQKNSPIIYVKGADMLDNTPIFDIKPYLPFTDAHPQAKSGYTYETQKQCLVVKYTETARSVISENDLDALTEILSQDPRPHYHTNEERVYAFEYKNYRICFNVKNNELLVTRIETL